MYKKRLKHWGILKYVKSDEKERRLKKLVSSEETISDPDLVRLDKLVRYAKVQVSAGALDSSVVSKLVEINPNLRCERAVQGTCAIEHNIEALALPKDGTSLVPSQPPPGEHADFELFLRAMQALIQREQQEWLTGQQSSPSATFDALSRGMALWRTHKFKSARKLLTSAAQNVEDDIQGTVSVSRICICISSIIWGVEQDPAFLAFAHFMATVALSTLGKECPLTIVLQQLQSQQSIEAQVRIWACALDGYEVSEQNLDHWWNMAQRRWRWCQHSGKFDLAAQYCDQALFEVQRVNKLTEDMKLEAQNDLETVVPGIGL